MSIKLLIAVTDQDWFELLRRKPDLAEVNFWAPSGAPFKALTPGELFLFKLHAPRNFIVGGGIFAYATTLPCSLAWEAFQEGNGARTLAEMRSRISKYRRMDPNDRSDFIVGCRVLTQPFFLEESDWIPVPDSWSPNIVSVKTYSTDEVDGRRLWEVFSQRITPAEPVAVDRDRFGAPRLVRPRLGQGAFRVLVTDVYNRRCAVTHERTLPALDAAHIRPYGAGGAHEPNNGLLLRRDIHSLFDSGYVTVTPSLKFEVSKRIREEFDNGRHYYALHGQDVFQPSSLGRRPDLGALAWHNENCFKG